MGYGVNLEADPKASRGHIPSEVSSPPGHVMCAWSWCTGCSGI